MSYAPSSVINNARDFRSQYVSKQLRVWARALKTRLGARQVTPVFMTPSKL